MVLKVPGMKREVGIRPAWLVVLALVGLPLLLALYLTVDVWRAGRNMYQDIPIQARATVVTEAEATEPVIVFPTEASASTPTAQETAPAVSTPEVSETQQVDSGTPEPTTPPGIPTEYDAGSSVPIPTQTGTVEVEESSIDEWNGKKRINVLLLGLDQRDDEVTRPDTIILASLDFEQNRASVLSIPRDLYVNVPGFQYWKINAAYAIGENPKHTENVGGGLGLMISTLQSNFNIGIDEFGVIDFEAFVRGVDSLGGIEIDVPEKLVDNRYPDGNKYTRVVFEEGTQHMDGETALKYARIRHSDNDFGRIQRQQQVLLAVQQKARNPATLVKAPDLLNIIEANVRTSLTLREQARLARWGASLPRENIDFYTLKGRIGSADGQSVVWIDKETADPTLQAVFGPEAGLQR